MAEKKTQNTRQAKRSRVQKPVIPYAFVQVKKSSLKSYWYSDLIGKFFLVIPTITKEYRKFDWEVVRQVNTKKGYKFFKGNYLKKTDCKIILRKV